MTIESITRKRITFNFGNPWKVEKQTNIKKNEKQKKEKKKRINQKRD